MATEPKYRTLNMPTKAHDLCKQLAVEMTSQVGRSLTMVEIAAASLAIANADRSALLNELRKGNT